jgi:hypothetical protein
MELKLSPGDISLSLSVASYAVRIYPGRSAIVPGNYDKMDLGYVTLIGSPTGLQYFIHFLPDGTTLPATSYDPASNVVQSYMSWCQFAPLIHLLEGPRTVNALFSVAAGVVFSDIESSYDRNSSTPGKKNKKG